MNNNVQVFKNNNVSVSSEVLNSCLMNNSFSVFVWRRQRTEFYFYTFVLLVLFLWYSTQRMWWFRRHSSRGSSQMRRTSQTKYVAVYSVLMILLTSGMRECFCLLCHNFCIRRRNSFMVLEHETALRSGKRRPWHGCIWITEP